MKKFPDEYVVVREHADVLGDLGKTDEAAKELRSLLNGTEDRNTLLALAENYEKGKRYPWTYWGVSTARRRDWPKAGIEANFHDLRRTGA